MAELVPTVPQLLYTGPTVLSWSLPLSFVSGRRIPELSSRVSLLMGPRPYNRCVPTGRQGQAITLVTQYDIHLLHAIEEQISK